jgi:hypothetical protein
MYLVNLPHFLSNFSHEGGFFVQLQSFAILYPWQQRVRTFHIIIAIKKIVQTGSVPDRTGWLNPVTWYMKPNSSSTTAPF